MAAHRREEVAKRIARVHGHVHAIKQMVDEGRSYSDIVHQISAVRSALDSVLKVIVEDLVEDCVTRSNTDEPLGESLTELQQVVTAIR